MPRPVSGSVLACDSSSREREVTCASIASAWIARGGLDELLDRLGEAHGIVLEVVAERAQEHGLERGDVARHVGRARLAAAARSAASDAARSDLLLRQLERIAVAARRSS